MDRTGRLTSDYNGRFTYKPSPRPSVVGRAQKTTLVLVLVGLFHLNSQSVWFEKKILLSDKWRYKCYFVVSGDLNNVFTIGPYCHSMLYM